MLFRENLLDMRALPGRVSTGFPHGLLKFPQPVSAYNLRASGGLPISSASRRVTTPCDFHSA